MSFINKLFGKKEDQSPIVSILPEEIYQAGVLELKDEVIHLYPNPVIDELTVSGFDKIERLRIFDIKGQQGRSLATGVISSCHGSSPAAAQAATDA